jgi:hypothetical protein
MGILGVGMAKTSLKYEQPSRASQIMVLGFSVAVAFMAGWLVLTLLLGNGGSTMVATADDEVPAMTTKQPPRVENPRVASSAPIVAPRQLLSPQADPGSWPGAATATVPAAPANAARAAPAASGSPALASLPGAPAAGAPAPAVAAPATVPAAQSPTASPSINDRIAVGDIYAQVTNKIADEPADLPDIVPLPPHRPRISVPFPRPRPQLEEQAQAQAEPRSFFDFLTGGR